MGEIKSGDLVRLVPRERPFYDRTSDVWRVVRVHEHGAIDVVAERRGGATGARRGVDPASVIEQVTANDFDR